MLNRLSILFSVFNVGFTAWVWSKLNEIANRPVVIPKEPWHPPCDYMGSYGEAQLIGPDAVFGGIERGRRILNLNPGVTAGIWVVDEKGIPSRPTDFSEGSSFGGNLVVLSPVNYPGGAAYICASGGVVGVDAPTWVEVTLGGNQR
jgi:hypothetical protein